MIRVVRRSSSGLKSPLILSVLASAIALSGCLGGGGGGGGGASAGGGSLSGIGAKGFLRKAKVTAFCGSETGTALATTTTADPAPTDTTSPGYYQLSWTAACSKPVKVVIEGQAGTTMDDEIKGNVAAPSVKLSAYVADPATTKTVNVTPITTMTASLVDTAPTLNAAAVATAATTVATKVLNGDIEAATGASTPRKAADLATASDSDKKLAALLTAVSSMAKNDAVCGAEADDDRRVNCAVTTLSDSVAKGFKTDGSVGDGVKAVVPATKLKENLAKLADGTETPKDTTIQQTLKNVAATVQTAETDETKNPAFIQVVNVNNATGIQAARDLFATLRTDLQSFVTDSTNAESLNSKLKLASADMATFGTSTTFKSAQMYSLGLSAFDLIDAVQAAASTKSLPIYSASSPNAFAGVSLRSGLPIMVGSDDGTAANTYYFITLWGLGSLPTTGLGPNYGFASCKVSASNLSEARCRYAVTKTSTQAIYSVLKITKTSAGTGTWSDFTRAYTLDANGVPTSTYTDSTGYAGAISTTYSNGVRTAQTLVGDLAPSGGSTDKEAINLSFSSSSTGATFSGSISKGAASVALTNGSLTLNSSNQLAGLSFGTSLNTGAFKYEGSVTLADFASDLSNSNYSPTKLTFTGKISKVSSSGATEFFSGTFATQLTGYATYNPALADSATNYVKAAVTLSGTVTQNAVPAQLTLTWAKNDGAWGKNTITLGYSKSGTSFLTGSSTFNTGDTSPTFTLQNANGIKVVLTYSAGNVSGEVDEHDKKIGTLASQGRVDFDDGTYTSAL